MFLDPAGVAIVDAAASAMRSHETAKALHMRAKIGKDARLKKLAGRIVQHTRHCMSCAARAALAYCGKTGAGIRQIEDEVERRRLALRGDRDD